MGEVKDQLPESFAVYKTKPFARIARKASITDNNLWNAANQANQGSIDADLGGGVIKQRIARAGKGKSGGSRAVILFRKAKRAVYVYAFEKKDRANISRNELEAYRELARVVLNYSESEIAKFVAKGALVAVAAPKQEKEQ